MLQLEDGQVLFGDGEPHMLELSLVSKILIFDKASPIFVKACHADCNLNERVWRDRPIFINVILDEMRPCSQ